MPGGGEIVPDTLGRLRVNRERVLSFPLANDSERIEAAILVQVANPEASDFGPPEARLKPY